MDRDRDMDMERDRDADMHRDRDAEMACRRVSTTLILTIVILFQRYGCTAKTSRTWKISEKKISMSSRKR